MNNDAGHRLNRRSYNAIAGEWDAVRLQFTAREFPAVEKFLQQLPSNAFVLDLGCGSGRPMAELLLAHDHDVLGVDQSPAMLARARAHFPQSMIVGEQISGCLSAHNQNQHNQNQHNQNQHNQNKHNQNKHNQNKHNQLPHNQSPQVCWQLAAIETYAFPSGLSAVVCWDALFHLRRAWHAPLFARMAAALPAGAVVLLSCGGSVQPPFTDRMLGRQFFYDSHDPGHTAALLKASGFSLLWQALIDEPDGAGNRGRAALLAQRD